MSFGLIAIMNASAPAVNTNVLAEYMIAGPKQLPYGIQVVGGARHDVAGAGALVVRMRKTFQVLEKVVAEVELNVARDADHYPARQELEYALRASQRRDQQGIELQLIGVTPELQAIYSAANYLWKQYPDAVVKENANCAQHNPVRYFFR